MRSRNSWTFQWQMSSTHGIQTRINYLWIVHHAPSSGEAIIPSIAAWHATTRRRLHATDCGTTRASDGIVNHVDIGQQHRLVAGDPRNYYTRCHHKVWSRRRESLGGNELAVNTASPKPAQPNRERLVTRISWWGLNGLTAWFGGTVGPTKRVIAGTISATVSVDRQYKHSGTHIRS